MMRLASTLLILTLLTTSAVSGTFAKYTTSATASDSARVAKWGVEVTVTGNNAFLLTYDTDDADVKATIQKSVTTSSTGDDPVLAPGTSGTLGTIQVTGKPEVATKVEVDVDFEIEKWTATVDSANVNYFPVKITVGGTEVTFASNSDPATIEKAVEDAVVNAILHKNVTGSTKDTGSTASVTYAPNTDELADEDASKVEWAWPYYVSEDNDVKDTSLGDKAEAATISFNCTVTVTQVD